MSANTYLTTDELAARIKYDVRTIRERLKDSVLLEGVHYIRPFGGRKILYVWEQIEKDMALESLDAGLVQAAAPTRGQSEHTRAVMIPMASGVACQGSGPIAATSAGAGFPQAAAAVRASATARSTVSPSDAGRPVAGSIGNWPPTRSRTSPNVFVCSTQADASAKPRCTSATCSGCVHSHDSGDSSESRRPRAISAVPIPPSQSRRRSGDRIAFSKSCGCKNAGLGVISFALTIFFDSDGKWFCSPRPNQRNMR